VKIIAFAPTLTEEIALNPTSKKSSALQGAHLNVLTVPFLIVVYM
jgi:hypothetical protein